MLIDSSITIHTVAGPAAAAIDFMSCGFYLRSIMHGSTKPDRVTWWVLSAVSAMITFSYFSAGARDTLWLPASYTVSFILTALASLKYGDGPITLSILDRISLLGATVSAIIWWLLNSALLALWMNIATEFIGLVPTISKSIYRPWTESRLAWCAATIASILNVIAIDSWSVAIALYPLYIFVTNAIITAFLFQKYDSTIPRV